MDKYRKLPDFYGKDGSFTYYLVGTIILLPALFFFYLGFINPRSNLSEWGGFLMAICGGAWFAWFALSGFMRGASNRVLSEKKNWLTSAIRERTAILGREIIENEYAAIYDVQPTEWHLKLEPTTRQSAIDPGMTYVVVNLKKKQYQHYEDKRIVSIYCSASNPFEFLLEDEV